MISGQFVDCRKGLWTCLIFDCWFCKVAKPALIIYTIHWNGDSVLWKSVLTCSNQTREPRNSRWRVLSEEPQFSYETSWDYSAPAMNVYRTESTTRTGDGQRILVIIFLLKYNIVTGPHYAIIVLVLARYDWFCLKL